MRFDIANRSVDGVILRNVLADGGGGAEIGPVQVYQQLGNGGVQQGGGAKGVLSLETENADTQLLKPNENVPVGSDQLILLLFRVPKAGGEIVAGFLELGQGVVSGR